MLQPPVFQSSRDSDEPREHRSGVQVCSVLQLKK